MQTQLLSAFNTYAFNNATQILLSNLNNEQLREILLALHGDPMYGNLTHMVRVTLFLNVAHRIDRSLYMAHYLVISVEEFRNERRSLVAGCVDPQTMVKTLENYDCLEEKVEALFQEDAETVFMAAFDPELALPPARRSTVAPSCQTVYQVVLACEKIDEEMKENYSSEQSDENETKIKCFNELLAFHAEMAEIELSSITEPFEHFSELVLRFMVYRNSVLAMHEIIPFPCLSQTMKLWSNRMVHHYQKANNTFAEMAGFKFNANSVYGRFTPDLLIEEGYMNEYVEALVDLSIDDKLVAFCAHSKQNFGELYQCFENIIIDHLQSDKQERSKEQLQKWCNYGLKPCTLLKIIERSSICDSQEIKYDYCLRKDSYIQSCAKIHGFTDDSTSIIVCS